MNKKQTLSPIAAAIGAAFAGSLAATPMIVNAAENPFAASELSHGYVVAMEGKCGGMKSGEKDASDSMKMAPKTDNKGMSGGMMAPKTAHESMSGGMMMTPKAGKEGKCGGMNKAPMSTKGMKMTPKTIKEGKCGEGKCGGMKM